jgi:uncharacterized protein (TIGR02145 family)
MIFTKASLTCLFGVSLLIADISGIVTDTSGITPIAGAVVQLEKNGSMTTTGTDGSFTFVINTTSLSDNSKAVQNGISAKICGNMSNVTIAGRSTIEIATFDLTGKMLAIMRRTLDAGNHSIAIPYQGTGIHIYKVKAGNSEFMLKGNSFRGVSTALATLSQGSSSNALTKQAKAMSTIYEVIKVTKTGYLNHRCTIRNSNTSGVIIKMIANEGNVTDVDGNVYQSVKIGNQVWLAENLRVTKYNDGTSIPNIADSAAWNNINASQLETPAYCYYNNTANIDSIKDFGALYNWYVLSLTNTRKIAPAGWHVPTNAEWDTLQNCLIAKGYNWDGTTTGNKIAKSLAARTGWGPGDGNGTIGSDLTKNNRSGFSALPGGVRRFDAIFVNQGDCGFWWSATKDSTSGAWFRLFDSRSSSLGRMSCQKSYGFSVRLVRD